MTRRAPIGAALLALLLTLITGTALAHENRPGYLELTETGAESYAVLWKVPMKGDLRLRLDPAFPADCERTAEVIHRKVRGAAVERWSLGCDAPLVGRQVGIDGLDDTFTDVLVRYQPREGAAQTGLLRPAEGSFTVAAKQDRLSIAGVYLGLGFEHILLGFDHLLFVLALLLIVRGRKKLVATITAFTVAHSITLALATFAVVRLPAKPVEAVIALSIIFLAAEIVHLQRGRPGLTSSYPWVVAFTFGLLHGFGFAGALSEIGLPQSAVPLALFLFNVGVELGQLAFVAVMLGVAALAARFKFRRESWALGFQAYAIGALAAFWMIQRVVGFWSI